MYMMKTVTWIVAIVVVAAGAWYVWQHVATTPSAIQKDVTQEVLPQPPQQAAQAQPTAGLSTGGSSDAELNQDMSQIDAQIQSTTDANTSVDQGVNDKAVPQTE